MTMDGLTVNAVAAELSQRILGSRVQQIYHPDPNILTLELWAGQERTLLIQTGENARVHLTTEQFEHPKTPSAFCMLLRKYIKNGVILQATQPGVERVLDLQIRHEDEYVLRTELLGQHSNAILLKDLKVLGALKPVVGKRSFRPGEPYQPPLGQDKLDPFSMTQEEFFARLSGAERFDAAYIHKRSHQNVPEAEIAKAILNSLDGLGPRLAKELAVRAKLDPTQPAASLTEQQRAALWAAVGELFEPLRTKRFQPCVYFRDGKPVDVAPFPLQLYSEFVCEQRESISEALDECVRSQTLQSTFERERKSLQALVSQKGAHARGALERVRKDLEQAQGCERLKHEGDLLMANLHALRKGLDQIEVEDFRDGAKKIVKLDPALEPVANAQKKFERYKKLKRAREKLEARLGELQRELDYWEDVKNHLEQVESESALDEIRSELASEGYISAGPRERGEAGRSGPREFVIRGYRVWVGRSSRQNDELVRGAAREDYWLHARERPGSHVIIKNPQQREVPFDVLQQAAQLAAYYSKGRDAGKVPVSYTRVKYLRKPKGARPGLVLVTQEEGTLAVAPKGDF